MRCLLRGGIFFYFFIFITILYIIPPGLNNILYSSARFLAMRAEFPFGISYAKFLLTKADLYIAPLFPEIQKRTYAKFLFTKVNVYIGPSFLVIGIGRNFFGITRICKKFAHPWLDLHLNSAQTYAPNGYGAITERPGVGKNAKILNILLKSSWKCQKFFAYSINNPKTL